MEDKVEKEDAGEVSRPFPWKDHKYQGEPQWDHFTDSDGEQYETYSDGTHEMTKKEMKEYARQVKESDGYDVQEFDKVTAFGIIQPLLLTEKSIPEFERLASIALSEYNKDKGKRLRVKEIKKAMIQVVTGMTYYLTFDVVDPDVVDDNEVFQARVLELFKKDEFVIKQIRRKPTV